MSNGSTVFVVDDDKAARHSVCALVRSMGLRAEAFSSAEEFLSAYVSDRSGCLVTDVRMLGMSGIELQEELNEKGVLLPVIVMTAYPQTPLIVRAVKAGAVTVLEKPYEDNELWDAIRQALTEDATKRVEHERRQELRDRIACLTVSEREVMDMIVKGLPNKAIAQRLDLSVRTVESRRHEIFEKLQANSLAELVGMVIEAGSDR